MNRILLFSIIVFCTSLGCIGDDFVFDEVEPVLRITSNVSALPLDTSFQLTYVYLNNIGEEEVIIPSWSSSNDEIISVDENGLVNTLSLGTASVFLSFDNGVFTNRDTVKITVGDTTIIINEGKSGIIRTTSSYLLEGEFKIREEGSKMIIEIAENYRASTALPGLYLYLSNNPAVVSNGYEIGKVTVFSGEHSYEVEDIGINEYRYLVYFCKPFNVKVGDGEIE